MSNSKIDFERKKWNEYYSLALAGKGQESEPSLWWQISDDDSAVIVKKHLAQSGDLNVLEAGCGSGGSSFYLGTVFRNISITLCDISENALTYAKSIEPVELSGKVRYFRSAISSMPFQENTFDLTWNVGVVEHYNPNEIIQMAMEMMRVTKAGGNVIISIPNRNSIATLKAYFLGSGFGTKFFRWVPGYRFDSEILYRKSELYKILSTGLRREVSVEFAGNLLWVSAPQLLVRLTNKWFRQSRFSFLLFFIIRK